jgi:hypothetical protein
MVLSHHWLIFTKMNRLAQYTTTIGKQTVHFVHEKSDDEDAIPLLLIHGWPGLCLAAHKRYGVYHCLNLFRLHPRIPSRY